MSNRYRVPFPHPSASQYFYPTWKNSAFVPSSPRHLYFFLMCMRDEQIAVPLIRHFGLDCAPEVALICQRLRTPQNFAVQDGHLPGRPLQQHPERKRDDAENNRLRLCHAALLGVSVAAPMPKQVCSHSLSIISISVRLIFPAINALRNFRHFHAVFGREIKTIPIIASL